MTDHKFTDEEVIKALECCADATQNSCKGCPCKAKGMRTGDVCIPAMSKAAADLIKRQRAEIEKLQTVNADMNESLRLAAEANKDMQAETKRLTAFKGYFDSLYGTGLEIAKWHENGSLEAFDNFYDAAMEEYESNGTEEAP